MNNSTPDNGIWLDPNGLQQLRHQATTNREAALRSAAEQFEAQFVAQMLKAMRATVPKDGVLSGRDEDLYRGLMDRQMALNIARGRSFGLTESITRQMGKIDSGVSALASEQPHSQSSLMPLKLNGNTSFRVHSTDDESVIDTKLRSTYELPDSRRSLSVIDTPVAEDVPNTPAAFVHDILPYARQAAKEIGVSPEVLVAQSALETGWGKHVIRHADGRSTFNFFNIKAHGGEWQGATVAKTTFEYSEGIPRRVRDRFRAYDSPQSAFSDYVDFVATNPRYEAALDNAGDPHGYIRALQAAGYATDPKYASKIIDLLDHPAITAVRQAFKNTTDVPTNTSANNPPAADRTDQS